MFADENKWAWAAGFMDGDGSFYPIMEKRIQNRSGFRVQPEVNGANTSYSTLVHLREIFGCGRIGNDGQRRRNHKQMFKLRLRRSDILNILPRLIPHLVTKKMQAELLFELCKLTRGTSHRYSQEEWNKIVWIYNEIRRLNMRGCRTYSPFIQSSIPTSKAISIKICEIKGCKRKHYGRNLCSLHWKRMYRKRIENMSQLALVSGGSS